MSQVEKEEAFLFMTTHKTDKHPVSVAKARRVCSAAAVVPQLLYCLCIVLFGCAP